MNYEAATLVNAVIDAFIEANDEWSEGMTQTQIKNLEGYRIDLKNQTDDLERRWKDLVARGDVDSRVLQDVKTAEVARPPRRTRGPAGPASRSRNTKTSASNCSA